jgi:hypothetical protein
MFRELLNRAVSAGSLADDATERASSHPVSGRVHVVA